MIGFIAPAILFSMRRVRHNNRLVYRASQLAVLGFMMNRLNVGITGFEVQAGIRYTPAWSEVAVTLMLVTIGVTAFYLATKYLPVMEEDESAPVRDRVWSRNRGRLEEKKVFTTS